MNYSMKKGYASTNVVCGFGSYGYQMVSRDTFGSAIKLNHAVVNGEHRDVFKNPVSDDGTKKSLKGLLCVAHDWFKDGEIIVETECTPQRESEGLLQVIYEDGKFYNQTTLEEIRERLKQLK